MFWRNRVAKVAAPKLVGKAIKWAVLERRSTMTHMTVFPVDRGKWVIKSIVMSCQTVDGIGRG